MADHYDTGSDVTQRPAGGGGGGSKNIEWGKYGLSEDGNANATSGGDAGGEVEGGGGYAGIGDSYQQGVGGEKIQELFDEQQQVSDGGSFILFVCSFF